MIESISAKNFYCFKEKATLSFVAGKERNRVMDSEYCGFVSSNKVNLLKNVYLLGNNGAGKSKILLAFRVLQYLVGTLRERSDENLRFVPFAFDDETISKPSEIEIIYHLEDKRFKYFIEWDKDVIQNETLCELKPRSEQVIFSRHYDFDFGTSQIVFGPSLKQFEDGRYLLTTNVLRNNSLLGTLMTLNMSISLLQEHLEFLMEGFEIVDLDDIDLDESLPYDESELNRKLKAAIIKILKVVDTNIVAYEKLKYDMKVPKEFLERLKSMSEKDQQEFREILRLDEQRHTVNTYHRLGKEATQRRGRLPLSSQSEGTKEILKFLMVINDAILNKKMIILDDYSSKIQRNTLFEIMKLFVGVSDGAQLVFATQDYSLMDFELIRRDSIRFLVKDEDGIAHVEPIKLALLHKNSSLRHYVGSPNKMYKQIPEINTDLFNELIEIYRSL